MATSTPAKSATVSMAPAVAYTKPSPSASVPFSAATTAASKPVSAPVSSDMSAETGDNPSALSGTATSRLPAAAPTHGSSATARGSPTALQLPDGRDYIHSNLGNWEELPIPAGYDGGRTTTKRAGSMVNSVGKDPRAFLAPPTNGSWSSKRPSAQEVQKNGLDNWRWKETKGEKAERLLLQGKAQAQERTAARKASVSRMTLDEIVEKFAPRPRQPAVASVPQHAKAQQTSRGLPQPMPSDYRRHKGQGFVDRYRPEANSYRRPAADCYRPSYARSTASSRAHEICSPVTAEADTRLSRLASRGPEHVPVKNRPPTRESSSSGIRSANFTTGPYLSPTSREGSIKSPAPVPTPTRPSPAQSDAVKSANTSAKGEADRIKPKEADLRTSNASTKASARQTQLTAANFLDNELTMLPPSLQAKLANPTLPPPSALRHKRPRAADEAEENEFAKPTISKKPKISVPSAGARAATKKKVPTVKNVATKKAVATRKAVATKKAGVEKPACQRRPDHAGMKRKRARDGDDAFDSKKVGKNCKRQKTPLADSSGESDCESDVDDFIVHDTPQVTRRRKKSGGAARKFVKG
ncbi:uncharacterized protein EI97DRAFT_498089 [Westerdykella ornata]|uniref:Uncharacterized protein n=1 Tax=Westerdykella ornata TaxID=318751 RepID=A0A6A6JY17_WESOR|nr:uncharacterized protein EI97DRAFT_498089 [Westerdykella ornata]KAF2281521.1 hypothetical protein EI97DRAFT_498089 [Westerdykella ornata]